MTTCCPGMSQWLLGLWHGPNLFVMFSHGAQKVRALISEGACVSPSLIRRICLEETVLVHVSFENSFVVMQHILHQVLSLCRVTYVHSPYRRGCVTKHSPTILQCQCASPLKRGPRGVVTGPVRPQRQEEGRGCFLICVFTRLPGI